MSPAGHKRNCHLTSAKCLRQRLPGANPLPVLRLCLLLVFALVAQPAMADIFSPYLGLEKMVERAEAMAVVEAIDRVTVVDGREITWAEYTRPGAFEYNPIHFTRSGVEERWRVRLVRKLKGDFDHLTTDTLTMSLGVYGFLGARPTFGDEGEAVARLVAECESRPGQEIMRGETYLVFLMRTPHDRSFRSLNASGSMIPVRRGFARDLGHFEKTTPELLRALLIREADEHSFRPMRR